MKPAATLLLTLLALTLSACSHLKPKDVVYDENAQGTLEIPSYTREALDGWPEGRKLEPHDATRVRFPDNVHAYHLGRLPSYDRREMHEAHTVYRVEQSAHWDQRLPATPMESRGVIFGIREPSNNPVPADQVVANERTRQLQLSADIQKRLDDLRDKQMKLEAFLASAPDKSKTIDKLQVEKAKLEKDLADLQQQSTQMARKIKEFEDQQAILDATTKGSKKKP